MWLHNQTGWKRLCPRVSLKGLKLFAKTFGHGMAAEANSWKDRVTGALKLEADSSWYPQSFEFQMFRFTLCFISFAQAQAKTATRILNGTGKKWDVCRIVGRCNIRLPNRLVISLHLFSQEFTAVLQNYSIVIRDTQCQFQSRRINTVNQ